MDKDGGFAYWLIWGWLRYGTKGTCAAAAAAQEEDSKADQLPDPPRGRSSTKDLPTKAMKMM
jgi:hypothetical protein